MATIEEIYDILEEFESREQSESEDSDYSPPAWKHPKNSRDSSPEYESAEDGADKILAAAARTRLPTGSLSPEKRRSPSPNLSPTDSEDVEEDDQKMRSVIPAVPVPNNCMHQYFLSHN